MLRSVTTLVPLSLFIILSLPAIAIYISFEIALFDNNILTTLQHFLLSQTFFLFKSSKYSLLLFRKSFTHKFLWLVYLSLFSSVLFLRKMFLSFVISIIALEKFIFMKDQRPKTSHIPRFTRSILI